MTGSRQFFSKHNVCIGHHYCCKLYINEESCRECRACYAKRCWHWRQNGYKKLLVAFLSAMRSVQTWSRFHPWCILCSFKRLKQGDRARDKLWTKAQRSRREICFTPHCLHHNRYGWRSFSVVHGATTREVQVLVSIFYVREMFFLFGRNGGRSQLFCKQSNIYNLCDNHSCLRDFLLSVANECLRQVCTSAFTSLRLNGFIYHCYTLIRHVDFENVLSYDVKPGERDPMWRVKNNLQKPAPVNYSLRTLSGVEEGNEELAYSRVFLRTRHKKVGCSQYLANLFHTNLILNEIRITCMNCEIQPFLAWLDLSSHYGRNYLCCNDF